MPSWHRFLWLIFLVAGLCSGVSGRSQADTLITATRNYIDLSAGRIEGDFETTVNSSLNSVTAVFGRFFMSGTMEASLSFSYLDLASDGQSNQAGMGDIIAKISGKIYNGALSLYPALAVKIPTADEVSQLGSGETDVGAFLSLIYPCAAYLCGAGLDYIVIGEPPGVDYRNIVRVNLNLFRRFNRTGVGVKFQQETALVDGGGNPQYLGISAFYVFTPRFAIYTETQAGLNDAAADYVFRMGLVQRF